MRLHRFLILLSFVCGTAWATRPMVDDMSLDELVRESDLIALVEKPHDFAVSDRKEDDGCVSQRWPLKLLKVLKAKDASVREGETISVIANHIKLMTCGFDQRRLSVTYLVPTYKPEGPGLEDGPGPRFVIFLRSAPRGFELAAVNSYEAESLLPRIAKLIKP